MENQRTTELLLLLAAAIAAANSAAAAAVLLFTLLLTEPKQIGHAQVLRSRRNTNIKLLLLKTVVTKLFVLRPMTMEGR